MSLPRLVELTGRVAARAKTADPLAGALSAVEWHELDQEIFEGRAACAWIKGVDEIQPIEFDNLVDMVTSKSGPIHDALSPEKWVRLAELAADYHAMANNLWLLAGAALL